MQFDELIQELSLLMDIPLQPEPNQTCSILVDDKLTVQLEVNQQNLKLIVFAYICVIPPGKFRENVLLQTLKANAMPIRIGTFSFFESTGELTFFHSLLKEEITAERVSNFLTEFIYVASLWHEAVHAGKAAPDQFISKTQIQSGENPFGLKP